MGNYISLPQIEHPENLRGTKTIVTLTFELFQKVLLTRNIAEGLLNIFR